MPRVSVIIPAYNAQRYIAETLRSVEAQTYDDWEVVLCDDGSTDDTAEVAQSFGERITVVRGSANTGPSAARNRALDRSRGELVAFLDADDYWFPTYLEHLVYLFDDAETRGGHVGIVACNAKILGADGFLPRTYFDLIDVPEELTLTRLLLSNPIFTSALSPRAAVVQAGGFWPELSHGEDYDLWLRIVELGYRVILTDRPLAVYRVTPGSLSTDPAAMARGLQMLYRRALERGNLPPRERRIAKRELRRQRAFEKIASVDGISYRRVARAFPLLVRVALEHPTRWPSYIRSLGRENKSSRFGT